MNEASNRASRRDELVAFVESGFEASNRSDFTAALAFYDDDIEIYAAPGVGNEGTWDEAVAVANRRETADE